jgi:hypothetical protein
MVEVIDELSKDSGFVKWCWNKMQERKKTVMSGGLNDVALFKPYTSLKKLVDNESEWIVLYIASVSNMLPDDLITIVEKDDQALTKILQLDSQLNVQKFRLTPPMLNKDVLWHILDALSIRNGRRLKQFKTMVANDGTIKWPSANFTVATEDNLLSKLTHLPSGMTVDIKNFNLTSDYVIQLPWDDLGAQLARPPLPPVRLHSFFKQGEGPKMHPDANKPKVFDCILAAAASTVESSRKRKFSKAEQLQDQGQVAAAKVSESLKKQKKAANDDKMKGLREKAAAIMRANKKKTEFALK